MIWWHWIVLGAILLAGEMVVPADFYLLFVGLAALAVGALAGMGLGEPVWVQWALFSVFAVVSVLFLRGPLLTKLKPRPHQVDTMINEVATLLDDLAPGGAGKAESRGTTWSVINAGQASLKKGQRSRVERVEGLTLWIKAE
ncbi:MAG: NfeD family protein [Nitrospiraceae bacterium]